MYYVYILVDPRSNIPFYVGKGTGKRCYSHFQWNTSKGNRFKNNIISKLKSIDLTPTVEFYAIDIESEALAYDLEESLIRHFGVKSEGGLLTNICVETGKPPTRWGEENGFYGKQHTENNRKLFAENASRQWAGHKQSPEHIARRVASFDRDSARKRRAEANKSPEMRAMIANRNKIQGHEKNLNNVKQRLEIYRDVVKHFDLGNTVLETRRKLSLPYQFVWKIFRRPDYFKSLIENATNGQ